MAALLEETLFTLSGQSLPPSKDLYQIIITHQQVIWRWWKVSLRIEFRGAAPGELKLSHEEFLNDARLQHQVGMVFGPNVLGYTLALCQGHFDYLERLPDRLLLRILSFLDVQDICCLGQTSRRFRKLCDCKAVWESAIRSCSEEISENLEALAEQMGWRRIYFTFYHNKPPMGSVVDHPEPTEQPENPEPEQPNLPEPEQPEQP
ncbi:F-box only protein 36a [Colossoma macropomum]|uniref:F-box only protein 36a n=1 Tax=Colossoma macropomum TaxID=42526 RepID=UPI001864971E|nr:F-box only protein 36a [Colossoma macropomum]